MSAFDIDNAVLVALHLSHCIKCEDDPRELERLRSVAQHLERTIAAASDRAAAKLDQLAVTR